MLDWTPEEHQAKLDALFARKEAEKEAKKEVSNKRRRERNAKWAAGNRGKMNAYNSRWCRDNPDKVREKYLKAKYGITIQQFDMLFESQNRCCAICKSPKPRGGNGTWHVEHDHDRDEVRGITCHHCNVGLGHFLHSQELLESAISYLQSNWSHRNIEVG